MKAVLTLVSWLQFQVPTRLPKKKEKWTCADDIPPEPSTETKHQYECLQELMEHLLCTAHSKPGMETYCWIELALDVVAEGHHKFSHQELTLWARHMVSKWTLQQIGPKKLTIFQVDRTATKYSLPNIKKYNQPPSKKPRGVQAPPEVHIALKFTPTPGGVPAMQGSYIVSDSLIPPLKSVSAPGPSHPQEVPIQSSSAPVSSMGCRIHVPKAQKRLVTVLDDFP